MEQVEYSVRMEANVVPVVIGLCSYCVYDDTREVFVRTLFCKSCVSRCKQSLNLTETRINF